MISSVPEINEVLRYGTNISRQKDAIENYQEAIQTYTQLLEEHDRRIYRLKKCIFPALAFKTMLLIPSNILMLFGAKPSKFVSRFISFAVWLLALVYGMFSVEIKAFLISLFQHT